MTTIARLDAQPYVGAAAAPDVEEHDLPTAPVPSSESRLPAFALLAAGGSLALASLLGRGASPLLRLGGGIAGIGIAIGGAMMLPMGGHSDSTETSATDPTLAFNQELHRGRTPNGGAYSIASFFDAEGNPAKKADAARAEIVEYSGDGIEIARTFGTFGDH
jgi:hypothetical protein